MEREYEEITGTIEGPIVGSVEGPHFDYAHDYAHGAPVLTFTVGTEYGNARMTLGWNDGGLSALAFLRKQLCRDLGELEGRAIRLMSNHSDCYVHPDEFDRGDAQTRKRMNQAILKWWGD